ncbi:unnamed protein product [Effrenium voratum]|uniref:Uncharacterized protein n=1 Tax=Effrenium voratum TaxID=2562239 RepID=A0AA36IYG5_9DINO|nr:unnamed protein product [Effrenium voratum]
MQQLEIIVKKAIGLKHDGRHCVEFLLDGHSPERTHWVDDLYDTSGAVVQPKNFRNSRRCIRLKGGPDSYQGAFLHIALFHQRNIREDKRAAEAHLPFSAVRSFSGWVALEHKEKYGGKIFIEASLKDAAPPPSPAQPAVAAVLDDPELAEQMAILASIQSSHETKPSTKDSVPSWPSSWPQVPTNSAPAQPAQLALPAPAPISPPTAAAQMADLAEPAEWLPWPRFRAAWPKVPTPVTSAAPARSPRRKALLIGLDYLGTAAERFGRAGRRDMAEVAAILSRSWAFQRSGS